MMKISKIVLLLAFIFANTVFAQSNSDNQSVTYDSLITGYTQLTDTYNTCDLITFGETDSGKPLHLFLINSSKEFYPEAIQNKVVILIQNGIHAGEPCGIDASLEWAQDMLKNNTIPENVVIAIIPVYNIGGMLNRGKFSRANQNGPEEHGFRGNARYLDLNRDYIKNDSKNAFAFTRIFHWLKPHLFVDTHTSNGADYQYTMTLLSPRKERLDAHLSNFLVNKMEPYLYENYDTLSPYVNVWGTTPNKGIKSFNDLPRFSTGYAALFNCIGFTTEAHMWKPFVARKNHTRKFLELLTLFANENHEAIVMNKKVSDGEFPMGFESLNLKIDTSRFDTITFLSYKPEYRYSEILGKDQLHYNRNIPETIEIPYYNYFEKVDQVQVPNFYVVKSGWSEVIERLQSNNIAMTVIENDTNISGVGMYITDYSSKKKAYEGHFLHSNIMVIDSAINMHFFEGDYLISTKQAGWRYILNVLEPKSEDSFFAWNFYDEILQQKEWYSSYIFEEYAQSMLEEDPLLQMEYDSKLATDKKFEENGNYRMYWLYTKSPFYETGHNRLPILKIFE